MHRRLRYSFRVRCLGVRCPGGIAVHEDDRPIRRRPRSRQPQSTSRKPSVATLSRSRRSASIRTTTSGPRRLVTPARPRPRQQRWTCRPSSQSMHDSVAAVEVEARLRLGLRLRLKELRLRRVEVAESRPTPPQLLPTPRWSQLVADATEALETEDASPEVDETSAPPPLSPHRTDR